MSNNSYTKEFKIKAVELLEQGNKSVRQVAQELGVAENNLYNWRKQLQKKQEKAFPNQPQHDEKELELRRLKARVAEMQTLKYFNGQAAIQLIDYNADHNALLLQQAMPGISLKSLYPSQRDLVMDCYVKTMLTLHQKSLPKRHDFPHIREWLNAIDQVGKDKLPIDLIDKAIRLKNNLLNSLTHEILLHGDLHLDNVLQDGNEWIVIDPKGIVGDVEFEMAAFDFIYHSELDNKEVTDFYEKSIALISQKSNLNFQRIKDWVFVRLILSAAWSIEDNRDYSWAIQLARLL